MRSELNLPLILSKDSSSQTKISNLHTTTVIEEQEEEEERNLNPDRSFSNLPIEGSPSRKLVKKKSKKARHNEQISFLKSLKHGIVPSHRVSKQSSLKRGRMMISKIQTTLDPEVHI